MPDTARRNLSDELLTQVVLESFDNAQSPRIKEVLQSLVKHLHAFAVDVQLTEEEWAYGIDFLTRTGHITDDKRQEFILLSDVLGLSMQVIGINHAGAGRRDREHGVRPVLRGRLAAVRDRRRHRQRRVGRPVLLPRRRRATSTASRSPTRRSRSGWPTTRATTTSSTPDSTTPQARGHISADADGSYWFWSVLPEAYPIPHDGPVGDLLEAAGRQPDAPGAHPLPDQRARATRR